MATQANKHQTTVRLDLDQVRYIKRRAIKRSQDTGLEVVQSDIIREAIDRLRECEPVDEPAETAVA